MMKKLKILLVAMVLVMGVAFYIPTVSAETTEPPTEDVVTLEADEALTKIQEFITLFSVGLLSSTTFAVVGAYILNLLKKKALEKVYEAVGSNQISQATADKATKFIEDNYVELQGKFDDVCVKFDALQEKTIENNAKMQILIDKYASKDEAITELVTEYLGVGADD